MLHIERFEVNLLGENCYIAHDETQDAIVIDCGAYFEEEYEAIYHYIQSHNLQLRHHLLTHGHFDHLFGAAWIYETFGLEPELCEADLTTYQEQPQQIRLFLHREIPLLLPHVGKTFTDNDTLSFGTHTLRVISTPGHTPGSVCFYETNEGILFSGDNLFRGSIGRCDLPRSNPQALPKALREKILTLPDNVIVYPGHGESTTIAEERLNNPYIQE